MASSPLRRAGARAAAAAQWSLASGSRNAGVVAAAAARIPSSVSIRGASGSGLVGDRRGIHTTTPASLQGTAVNQLRASQRSEIATPLLVGIGVLGVAALLGLRTSLTSSGASNSDKWIKGGFQAKMDRREAAQILGLRETALTRVRVKEAHRRMMIANHPDRGGAPYLASKINEAKDLLDKQVSR